MQFSLGWVFVSFCTVGFLVRFNPKKCFFWGRSIYPGILTLALNNFTTVANCHHKGSQHEFFHCGCCVMCCCRCQQCLRPVLGTWNSSSMTLTASAFSASHACIIASVSAPRPWSTLRKTSSRSLAELVQCHCPLNSSVDYFYTYSVWLATFLVIGRSCSGCKNML